MSSTPTTAVVNVTPAQAAEWLAKNNTHNRALRENKVASYARDMASGAWAFNGDTIRFSSDGTLLDGQHRLGAIVRADVTVPCIVVWGLAAETQDTMDIGAHRALRDQLLLRGENNSRDLAAVARRAMLAERGTLGGGAAAVPTHAEMLTYIEANPGIRRAAEVAVHSKGRLPCAPSAIGTAFFMCAQLNESEAEYFYVTRVIDGIGLHEGDPAHTLRQRIQKEQMVSGRQMAPDDVYRYSILAWNHWRSGSQVTKLQAPKGGWSTAPVPRPKR